MHNIHAYTEPEPSYPGYLSLNECPDGVLALTVRSRGNGGRDLGTVEVPRDELLRLAASIQAKLGAPAG